jgi:hypothetical protein
MLTEGVSNVDGRGESTRKTSLYDKKHKDVVRWTEELL